MRRWEGRGRAALVWLLPCCAVWGGVKLCFWYVVRCGVVYGDVAWCGMVWHDVADDVVWHGAVWCGSCGMVWCGVAWYGMMWVAVVHDVWYDVGCRGAVCVLHGQVSMQRRRGFRVMKSLRRHLTRAEGSSGEQ